MIRELIDRIFGRTSHLDEAQPIPAPAYTPEDAKGWLRNQLRRDIAAGFQSRDEILQSAEDCFEHDLPDGEARGLAEEMLPELFAEHEAAQADWPDRTDCDRLDAAFAALEQGGIISRQNFSCCGTCGTGEIWDEIDAVKEAGGATRGYTFYHMQDTESAAQGSGLYLNYGACEEGEDAALGVASEIVAELERQGLTTNWNGSWNQRIGVTLDWKRRRSLAEYRQ